MLVLLLFCNKVFQLAETHKEDIDCASLTQQVGGVVLVVVVSTSAGVSSVLKQVVPIGREAQGGDRFCSTNTAGRGSCRCCSKY